MKPAFRTRFAHIRGHTTDQTRQNCLSLMRTTAQSVSVITTELPQTPGSRDVPEPVYHGATLSSFTSVSMYPYPLVTFSLRTPSRMAESLWDSPERPRDLKPHMVINLLSASQARLALQFSRPHEFQHPFVSTPYFLSQEGIPVLRGSLGALSCSLVGSWPLDGTHLALSQEPKDADVRRGQGEQGSELFLARVLRVESGSSPEMESTDEETALPLVYYRQRYVTVQDAESLLSQESASNPNKRTP